MKATITLKPTNQQGNIQLLMSLQIVLEGDAKDVLRPVREIVDKFSRMPMLEVSQPQIESYGDAKFG